MFSKTTLLSAQQQPTTALMRVTKYAHPQPEASKYDALCSLRLEPKQHTGKDKETPLF